MAIPTIMRVVSRNVASRKHHQENNNDSHDRRGVFLSLKMSSGCRA